MKLDNIICIVPGKRKVKAIKEYFSDDGVTSINWRSF